MAKVYILTDDDFDSLFDALKVDPKMKPHGNARYDSDALSAAHRFYNYEICGWVNRVKA